MFKIDVTKWVDMYLIKRKSSVRLRHVNMTIDVSTIFTPILLIVVMVVLLRLDSKVETLRSDMEIVMEYIEKENRWRYNEGGDIVGED